jgi:hypothetical protein
VAWACKHTQLGDPAVQFGKRYMHECRYPGARHLACQAMLVSMLLHAPLHEVWMHVVVCAALLVSNPRGSRQGWPGLRCHCQGLCAAGLQMTIPALLVWLAAVRPQDWAYDSSRPVRCTKQQATTSLCAVWLLVRAVCLKGCATVSDSFTAPISVVIMGMSPHILAASASTVLSWVRPAHTNKPGGWFCEFG